LGAAKPPPGFDYAGPLTEAVLLGSVACRFLQMTLRWNSPATSFDLADANRFVRRDYRPGWAPARQHQARLTANQRLMLSKIRSEIGA